MSTQEIIIRIIAGGSIILNAWLITVLFDANHCLNWFYMRYAGEARITSPIARSWPHRALLGIFLFPTPCSKKYVRVAQPTVKGKRIYSGAEKQLRRSNITAFAGLIICLLMAATATVVLVFA